MPFRDERPRSRTLRLSPSRVLWATLLSAIVLIAATGFADARSDYLVRLLETSQAFRVRAQAALSLGRLEADEAIVGALASALEDEHPAVRTAAAASLERLGDRTPLEALQRIVRRERDPGARRAMQSAVRVLRRAPRRRSPATQDPPPDTEPETEARYYVGVGVPGTKNTPLPESLIRDAHRFLQEQIDAIDGVEVAPANENNRAARRIIQRRRLTGYYIDSSVVSVGQADGNTRAVVSVIVGTYPGRDMRAILQGGATVPGATDDQAREQAVLGAFQGAIRRLPQAFAASARR